MPVRLFVGNLSYDVTEADLRAHFTSIGPLSSLALPTDRDTGKPRGFAFVEFRERADAEAARRRLNNQAFKGRPLAVSEARARDDHGAPRARARRAGPPRALGPAGTWPRRDPAAAACPGEAGRPAERGPKHPIYKRAAGPVRFSTGDEDGDEEERDAHGARRCADVGDTTPRSGPASVEDVDETLKRGNTMAQKSRATFQKREKERARQQSSTIKRSGGWRPKRSARPAHCP